MIRRTFLKTAAAVSLGLTLSAGAMADSVMRVASWLPPTHPQNAVVFPTWGKWIEEATEGRVKLEIEYGMGHPKTMFELVEDGVVDASWSFHGYVPGRFKLTQAVEQPLLGADAEAASVAHWRVNEKYFAKANEHDGLVLAALFTHGPGQIHMAQPINSLADLNGKKIRLGGGVQGVIGERLHVTAVGAPAPKVYEMMQQGVIDGVFIPMGEQKTLRLNEVARNVVALPGGMYLGSFSIFINPDFLDSLSEKDRQAVMSVSGEKLSALAGRAWDEGDKAGYEAAKEAGVNVMMVGENDPIAKEFREVAKGMDDAWIESVADRGVDAKAALEELRSIARNYGE
ncbi:TRAP transporter substrate-binding protein [Marinobacterium arenosum]|uniref:TRAP transporter substrate-binding protein n=1 Tax=Marinobacterium arenosum TaxID=2862496 RepID=UPI001C97FDDC|nr:TRAP transporter substrate-binding protein [Marinobacterium arenosum]MBY4678139.1 TRAP transporter substrate-binding protein [Marinobacterium arenosum]